MGELDHKEGWVLKNWCFWTVVLEKTLESPLDSKEIKPINPKGNQPWIFIGRTDGEAPILWTPDGKKWLTGKDLDAGKDWGQEEKGVTEDGWMALLTQWTWVGANSRRQWRRGKPGILLQRSQSRLSDWTTATISIITYLGRALNAVQIISLIKMFNPVILILGLFNFKYLSSANSHWAVT